MANPMIDQGSGVSGQASGLLSPALALVAEHGISLDAAAVVVSVGAGVSLEAPPVESAVAEFVKTQAADSSDSGILTNSATPPPLDCVASNDGPPDDAVVIDLSAPNAESETLEPAGFAALMAECWQWMRANLHWYAISTAVHLVLFGVAVVVLGQFVKPEETPPLDEVAFTPADIDTSDPPAMTYVDFPKVDRDKPPSILDVAKLKQPESRSAKRQYIDNSKEFQEDSGGRGSAADAMGGLGGLTVKRTGPGPKVAGLGGLEGENGTSKYPGRGGSGSGFGPRGKGHSDGVGDGRTRDTEISVAMALHWFFRHRNQNGSWSLSRFASHCTGPRPCSGIGSAESDSAATALGVLPFLGAGETHVGQGPYREVVRQALFWLKGHQSASGDLSGGSNHQMYAHALATLAMCEAYGMTKDPKIGDSAQHAVIFIEAAQNRATGGWRYIPADPTGGDTSVLGWQMMALRSAQLAGLSVNTLTMENAKKWLAAVSKGSQHGLYSYQPFKEATPTMTAIGMLSWQYLNMRADDPAMVEGKTYLMENLPDNRMRNTYYWYYGTQAMHNFMDGKWDTWNRAMRRSLLETQCHEGCASGSWDPENPTVDAWSEQGGRVVTTAFSTLSLEVYYRYLPIYNQHTSPSDEMPDTAPAPLETPPVERALESRL